MVVAHAYTGRDHVLEGTMAFRRTETDTGEDAGSITALLKRLGTETGDLMRAELTLAKVEMRELARQAALDGARIGAALALAFVGALVLAAAAVIVLGDLLGERYALAALLIGVVLVVTGGLLARAGQKGLARAGKPAHTLASLQADRSLAAQQLRQLRTEMKRGDVAPLDAPRTPAQRDHHG